MSDPMASKGVDRAVARVLTQVAATAPPARSAPADSPTRDPASADVASVGTVAAQLASKPPVDAERVAQIKKAIANGTFPILPATIADRILALRYDWMSNDAQSV